MLVVFVHGWGVTNTSTYGVLPSVLAQAGTPDLALQVSDLYLSKYISFADEVSLDDLARAMQYAIQTEVWPRLQPGQRFACITHSTGGPLVRTWLELFYKHQLAASRLSHLIMLAPANHGSALAQLGKGKLARMKCFAEGIQPGLGVLNWLELGSAQSWDLNRAWLDYACLDAGLYVFVLTGQTIDRQLYDHLNSYTGEAGSDGVVRVATTNLNYGLLELAQQGDKFTLLKHQQNDKYAFAILPGLAHSGSELGIMASVNEKQGRAHTTIAYTLQCLAVKSASAYKKLCKSFDAVSQQTQQQERLRKSSDVFLFEREFITSRYCMLVFKISDDRNNQLDDYDLLLTAGPDYSENHLPQGFFVDRQRNQQNPGTLTYYLDYDKMADWLSQPQLQGKLGFKLIARPSSGYAYYVVAEHRSNFHSLKNYFAPNQTLMISIQLTRHVSTGAFQLTQDLQAQSFKHQDKGGVVE